MCLISLTMSKTEEDNNLLYDFVPFHIIDTVVKMNLLITIAQTTLRDTCIMFL